MITKVGITMAVMDEFKEEREKIKEQSFKKKFSYFWYYYKWHVIGSIVGIAFLSSLIYEFATKKEDALYGVMLNGYILSEEDTLAQDFAEYAEIDTSEYAVQFNYTLRMSEQMTEDSLSAQEFLMVYSAAKDLDVCAMDPYCFDKYAYGSLFASLEPYLDSALLEKLSDKLYYVDYQVLLQIEEMQDNGESTTDIEIPDPHKPEEMEQPIPVGIDISGCSKFTDVYYYKETPTYIGIVISSERTDMAAKFIEYLFEE